MRRALQPAILLLATLPVAWGCASPPAPAVLAEEPVTRTAKLVFIGDVMSHTPQVAAARTADTSDRYDYTEVFRHFRPVFEEADITLANLETTLRTAPPYTGYPSFAAPAALAFDMRGSGVDIVTTANNHICDKGAGGIRSTLALLDSAGMRHTGAFLDSADRLARNPLRFTAGGLRFALFAYTYGTNGLPVPEGMIVNTIDTAVISRDLASARRDSADCVIVCYHWGEEYRTEPSAAQRELAAWTRSRGADLIIGHHPHVVEPFEAHLNADSTAVVGATYYSLGNFVSNQRRRHTDGGIAAEITLTRTDPPESSDPPSFPDPPESLPVSRPPVRFELGWRLAWVHLPRYSVLPAADLDTMLARTPGQDPARFAAARFMRDTRELLSAADTAFIEK